MTRIALTLTAVVVGALGLLPAAAQAELSCRGSAARAIALDDLVVSEPVRANAPADPCLSQSASTVAPTVIGPISADAVGAFTARGDNGSGGAALGSISHPAVTL